MDRLACVDLPALPLQLLLLREPAMRGHPAVVVDEDKPLGVVRWSNELARRGGVLPGMRYAAALSLARGLLAGVVSDADIAAGRARVLERLLRFSPDVEASDDEPGVFFVNASGLDPLFPSLLAWAERVRTDLVCAGFFSTVVVGHARFSTWAIARARPGYGVMRSHEEERRMAMQVPLHRLGLDPEARDALAKLGVTTVSELARLPPGGLLRRFGKDVHRVHRMATGDLAEPIKPAREAEPVCERLLFDFAVSDVERLLFFVKGRVDVMLQALSHRHEALAGLVMRFVTERDVEGKKGELEIVVRPATPTLDGPQLMNLVHLKLSSLELKTGVVELLLFAESVVATLEQARLFAELALSSQKKKRDLDAGARALARVRARFGDDAVVKARLTDGHLPEARYSFAPIERVTLPRARERRAPRRLVRRIYQKPEPLPPRSRHEPDGWLLRDLEHGSVMRVSGPYVVSGGWWRSWQQREYCFAETQSGAVLWVYYDRRRRRWFLHGAVE